MKPAWMIRSVAGLLAIACCAWSQQGLALGMGEPLQQSFLAEPLRIEVPVILGDLEAGELAVRVLPTPRDPGQPVSDFEIDASGFKARLDTRAGETTVVIETQRAVREPVIEVSVEVTGGGLKVLRHLTLLMEPRPVGTVQPSVSPSRPLAAVEPVAPAAASPSPVTAPLSAAPVDPAGVYGPVKPNESLSSIAAKLPGVSRKDVLRASAALMLLNPEALEGGDPNRLRTGSVLRIPGEGNIRSAPQNLIDSIARSAVRPVAAVAAAASPLPVVPAAVAPVASIAPSPAFSQPKSFRLRFDSQFTSYQRLKLSETLSPVAAAETAATAAVEPDERQGTVPGSEEAADATPLEVLADEARDGGLAPTPVVNTPAASAPAPTVAVKAPVEYSLMSWVLLFMSVVLAVILIRQMRQPVVTLSLPPKPDEPSAVAPAPHAGRKPSVPASLKLVRSATKISADERRERQGLMHRLAALRAAVLGEDSDLRKIVVIEAMVDEGRLDEAAEAVARLEEQTSSPQRRPG